MNLFSIYHKLNQINLTLDSTVIARISHQAKILSAQKAQPIVIAIAGGSCSGKTTQLALPLIKALGSEATLISQDHFQLGVEGKNILDPTFGADDPKNFGIPECHSLLAKLVAGQTQQLPIFNFKAKRRVGTQEVLPKPFIVFEGLYTLHQSLMELEDIRVYVDMPVEGRLIRRVLRNTLERYKDRHPDGIIQGFLQRVVPAHRQFNVDQAKHAHCIVHHPFDFQDSIKRFVLEESPAPSGVVWEKKLPRTAFIAVTKAHPNFNLHFGCDGNSYWQHQISYNTFLQLKNELAPA